MIYVHFCINQGANFGWRKNRLTVYSLGEKKQLLSEILGVSFGFYKLKF